MASVNVDSSKFLPAGVKLRESCSDPVLLKMLEEGVLADVTLTAKGGAVKAHRSVLACVSPVFYSMFHYNMKETLSSSVDIVDMSIDVLQLFLLLLYTTNEEDIRPQRMHFNDAIGTYFFDIIEAAHKYQVGRRLGCVLRSALLENLKPENCWHYLKCSQERRGSKSNGAYTELLSDLF